MTVPLVLYMQCLDAKRLVAFSTAWHVSVLSVLVLLVMLEHWSWAQHQCSHVVSIVTSSLVVVPALSVVAPALLLLALVLVRTTSAVVPF